MDVENRYFTIHRLILSIFGMWPYQQWYSRLINATFSAIILVMAMLTLMLQLIQTERSIDSISQYLQFSLPLIIAFVNLCYYCFYNKKMKMLLEHIKGDWELLLPVDAVIAKQYAETGRFYTFIFTLLCIPFPLIQITLSILLCKSNSHTEANKTFARCLLIPIKVPYLDDQEDFLYIISFLFVCVLGTELLIIEVGTLFLICIQHACGLFSIVGQRLEVMCDNWDKRTLACYGNDAVTQVFYTILYHTRAVEYTNKLSSLKGPLYCIDIGITVVILSCDILQFFQAYRTKNIESAFSSLGQILIVLIALLVISYWGQILLDHTSNVFKNSYMSHWYLAPYSIQKDVLIIMTSSTRDTGFMLTNSKVFSFEMFATLLQMSVSYFMALNSLQG